MYKREHTELIVCAVFLYLLYSITKESSEGSSSMTMYLNLKGCQEKAETEEPKDSMCSSRPAGMPLQIHCKINVKEGAWKILKLHFLFLPLEKNGRLCYIKGFVQISYFFQMGFSLFQKPVSTHPSF